MIGEKSQIQHKKTSCSQCRVYVHARASVPRGHMFKLFVMRVREWVLRVTVATA
jgi:hypothetical protein